MAGPTTERPSVAAQRSRPPLWLGLLLAAALTIGCENQVNVPRGAVSGTVLDRAGHRIAGARVTSHRSLHEALTGADGRYSFTSLDEGTHRLEVVRAGYRPATLTILLERYGDLGGIDFRLEPLADRLTWNVFARRRDAVTVDVFAAEPMNCQVRYQGTHLPMIATPWTTSPANEHRFDLAPLWPGIDYLVQVEGVTSDGRRYLSATATVTPWRLDDTDTPPPPPVDLAVTQEREGIRLTWNHLATGPLDGFRIWRGEGDQPLALWQDEQLIFATERETLDPDPVPGLRRRYAVAAVDREGRVSSRSAEIGLVPAGVLTRDVVWKAAWSPIELLGDLEVPAGRNLTIEPGVLVRIHAPATVAGGRDADRAELIVDGSLTARGRADAPIQLLGVSAQPTRRDWLGIETRNPGATRSCELAFVEISGAEVGVLVRPGAVEIGSLTLRRCETGIQVTAASGTVITDLDIADGGTGLRVENTTGCRFERIVGADLDTGVSLTGNRDLTLARFDLRGVRRTGIFAADVATPTIRNGVIAAEDLAMRLYGIGADAAFLTLDSPGGIRIDRTTETPRLRNLIVINRTRPGTGFGITEATPGRSYPYNDIFGYLAPCSNCDQMGAPVRNVDPLFVGGWPFDYRLASASPVLNAAEGGGQIGAYGP